MEPPSLRTSASFDDHDALVRAAAKAARREARETRKALKGHSRTSSATFTPADDALLVMEASRVAITVAPPEDFEE
jgi:hypothetical protein